MRQPFGSTNSRFNFLCINLENPETRPTQKIISAEGTRVAVHVMRNGRRADDHQGERADFNHDLSRSTQGLDT